MGLCAATSGSTRRPTQREPGALLPQRTEPQHTSAMSKQTAHEILNFWKSGARSYQPAIINQALAVTGDLSPNLNRAYFENEDV